MVLATWKGDKIQWQSLAPQKPFSNCVFNWYWNGILRCETNNVYWKKSVLAEPKTSKTKSKSTVKWKNKHNYHNSLCHTGSQPFTRFANPCELELELKNFILQVKRDQVENPFATTAITS